MNYKSTFETILAYMPVRISSVLRMIPDASIKYITEIRLRVERPLSILMDNELKFLSIDGKLISNANSGAVIVNEIDISEIFNSLCRYSIHSSKRELSQGFFTLDNGIRVGVAGEYSGDERTLKYINAINFRFAREILGCSEKIFNSIFCSGRHSVLICGTANSGKTTILRDLCRLCSQRSKVTLIDERGELAASVKGIPKFDIGLQTDLIINSGRALAINDSIRTLSPHYIFCDEIGTADDVDAILYGHGSGVKFVSTIHAGNYDELRERSFAAELIDNHVFEYAVFLCGESFPGKISYIRRLSDD